MASAIRLLALATLFAPLVLAGCPANCPTGYGVAQSCKNTTAQNTCCFNAPGGQILQTQFWDTNPASGPANHWTIHGLWPDNCDGSYAQYCDENRQYTNITQILESFNQNALLTYMRQYWTDYHGAEESFWEHEWGKHGTCMSTLVPSCYSNYTPQEEVVDFFLRTVALFQQLDTYAFLAAAGIFPSSSKNYTLAQVQAALKAPRGVNAVVECSHGQLDEAYYYFETKGSIATGMFVPSEPVGPTSNCPATLQYLPKQEDTAYPVSSVSSSARATATLNEICRHTNGIGY